MTKKLFHHALLLDLVQIVLSPEHCALLYYSVNEMKNEHKLNKQFNTEESRQHIKVNLCQVMDLR